MAGSILRNYILKFFALFFLTCCTMCNGAQATYLYNYMITILVTKGSSALFTVMDVEIL